jgi:hypothetical protein
MECHIPGLQSSENQDKINTTLQVKSCLHACAIAKKRATQNRQRTCSNSNKNEMLPMEDNDEVKITIELDSVLETINETSNLAMRPAQFL